MTYNQIITLFRGIASASKYIHTFGTGELWEIDGIIKPGIKYPLLWCEPISSEIQEQVKLLTFRFICMDVVNKDKSNEQDVLSDTQLGLEDLIKVLRMESDDYTLVNNPTLEPFKEEFSDWCAGWRAEFQIELNFNSNDCDISSEDLAALVLNSEGDVLAYLAMGDTYTVVSPVNSVNGHTGAVVLDADDVGADPAGSAAAAQAAAIAAVDLQQAFDNGPTIITSELQHTITIQCGSDSDTENVILVKNKAGDRVLAIQGGGNVQLLNCPTSSVGLTSGMIWNDGGTLKIV